MAAKQLKHSPRLNEPQDENGFTSTYTRASSGTAGCPGIRPRCPNQCRNASRLSASQSYSHGSSLLRVHDCGVHRHRTIAVFTITTQPLCWKCAPVHTQETTGYERKHCLFLHHQVIVGPLERNPEMIYNASMTTSTGAASTEQRPPHANTLQHRHPEQNRQKP